MPSRWDAATHGWSRRVFHYPLPTLMSRNFRLPCTIELQPLSLTLLKMRKVETRAPCEETDLARTVGRADQPATRLVAAYRRILGPSPWELEKLEQPLETGALPDPDEMRRLESHGEARKLVQAANCPLAAGKGPSGFRTRSLPTSAGDFVGSWHGVGRRCPGGVQPVATATGCTPIGARWNVPAIGHRRRCPGPPSRYSRGRPAALRREPEVSPWRVRGASDSTG